MTHIVLCLWHDLGVYDSFLAKKKTANLSRKVSQSQTVAQKCQLKYHSLKLQGVIGPHIESNLTLPHFFSGHVGNFPHFSPMVAANGCGCRVTLLS